MGHGQAELRRGARLAAADAEDLEQRLLKAQVKARLLGGAPGPVRLGGFEIIRCLGRGGNGAVYEARDASGASVALKRLRAGAARVGAHTQREFRALQSVVHPNLVVLHELFCQEEQWFFTMELVQGVDLVSYARADPTPGHERLCAVFGQLLEGLLALHAARKLHRDLKPSNVLVDRAGRTVILDYGLVVDQDAPLDAASAGLVGTPAYMAPELLAGQPVGPSADLYAVGRMLDEALSSVHAPQAAPVAASCDDATDMLRQLCADLLRAEPARRPSAASALARLRGAQGQALTLEPGSPPANGTGERSAAEPFVGRASQLAALEAALARSQREGACVAWVHGASGMGKSALLRRFAQSARAAGALVLEGRCYERENTPFKAFDGVVASLARELACWSRAELEPLLSAFCPALLRVFPELGRVPGLSAAPATTAALDSSAQQRLAFDALRALLSRIAARAPLLLIIDDLQWGDADSARLLAHLLAPGAPALLVVGGFRSVETLTSPFLRRLFQPDAGARLACPVIDVALSGLMPDEARLLVQALQRRAPAPEAGMLERCVAQSAGVPFLLCELVSSDGATEHDQVSPDRLVRARAKRSSAAALELLLLTCVAAQPLRLSLASRASPAGASAWSSARELCALRLTRWRDTEGERCLEPYHDIIRDAIVRLGEPDETRRIHLLLARALEAEGTGAPEQRLFHWLGAGEPERARELVFPAGAQAEAALAWLRAADVYRTGLTLFEEGPERHALGVRLGHALAYAGEHAAAADAYRSAASEAGRSAASEAGRSAAISVAGDAAVTLEQQAAVQLLLAGRTAEGTALMGRLLGSVGVAYPGTPSRVASTFLRARLSLALTSPWRRLGARLPLDAAHEPRLRMLRFACPGLFASDPWAASALHARLLAESRGSGSAHELHALAWELARLSLLLGAAEPRALRRLRTELHALVRVHAGAYERATVQLAEAIYLIHARERLEDGLGALSRSDALFASCPGTQFERGCLETIRIDVLAALGDAGFKQHALARQRDYLGRSDGYSLAQLREVVPALHVMDDRPDLALAFLDAHWPNHGVDHLFDYFALWRRTETLLYQGQPEAAHALLRRHWSDLMRMPGQPQFVVSRSQLRARSAAALYAATRKPDIRREALAYCASARGSSRGDGAVRLALLASIAVSDGRPQRARALLQEALSTFMAAEQTHCAWITRYRLAQLAGDGEALERAHRWLERFGVRAPEAWVAMVIPGECVGNCVPQPGSD